MQHRSNRRLAAIVAADVAGYSRLVEQDEEETVRALRAHRRELAGPLLARHGGRLANTAGDSLLLEFPSAVDAVQYALAMQQEMEGRNRPLPAARRLRFRIGINVGDVIVDDEDLLGDGVNVAARLEALAEPGGICISRSVRDHVAGRLPVELQVLGEVRVKNISRPIEAFRVVMCVGSEGKAAPARSRRAFARPVAFTVSVALALALGVFGWQQWQSRFGPTSGHDLSYALPDKPSLLVLPFDNLSNDPQQDPFADGITEDLMTDLAKVAGLFVIARHSSFALRGKDISISEAAERLGVRFVLEGSVRRSGETLRMNAQLIDAATGEHVWADRFDGPVGDIFAAQDAFTLRVVEALEVKLSKSELERIRQVETHEIAAREAFQRGWELYSRFNRDDNARSVANFERAVELDPDYGRAYAALALVHLRGAVFFDWDVPMGASDASLYSAVPRFLQKAEEHGSALVHVVRALQHLNYRDQATPQGPNRGTDDARIAASKAIAAQPNDPEAHVMMAWALVAAMKPEEALGFVRAAMRLNPSYPSHYTMVLAAAHFTVGDLEQAAAVLSDRLEQDPQAIELFPMLAALRAMRGDRDAAATVVDAWVKASRVADPKRAIERYFFPIRWIAGALNTRLSDGLRLAALPTKESVDTLLSRVDLEDPAKSVEAIRALGWFGAAAAPAVERLIVALRQGQRRVQREAAISLGKIGPAAKAAMPALQSVADEPIVGFHAKSAIGQIDR